MWESVRMDRDQMRLWIDVMNTSHVHVFHSLARLLGDQHDIQITSRDFAENRKLLDYYGMEYQLYGSHGGRSIIGKSINAMKMIIELLKMNPTFDVNISMASHTSPIIAKLRSKQTIALTDNEYFIEQHPRLVRFFDHLIVPEALWGKIDLGHTKTRVHCFSGFKEDIYIADYSPSDTFPSQIPFDDFITLRPEAFQAVYVDSTSESFVPALLNQFSNLGINVVYLPRYEMDRQYAAGFDGVYVPEEPLNGLDLCHHSRVVLTGSGTFAREAACMGIPAISFYPGSRLLAVDQRMVDDGRILHSRIIKDIVDRTQREYDRDSADQGRLGGEDRKRDCRHVQDQVLRLFESIIREGDQEAHNEA